MLFACNELLHVTNIVAASEEVEKTFLYAEYGGDMLAMLVIMQE